MNYNITKYPDQSSYVTVNEFNRDIIRFCINSYEDLWHLNQLVDVYNSNGIKPHIHIPCLFDGQADKRFKSNQSSGLKLICNFLNNMNANFSVFHPHNPEVVEALIDGVEIIDNYNFISILLESTYGQLDESINIDNLILVSSDAGGYKPLMKLCDKLQWRGETYSASKSRKYEDGKSKLTQIVDRKDFNGKDILIIDDLSIYGGTFKGLSKLLRARNCGKLYLAVSHMTMQNLGSDPVTNYYDHIFTTDSKYDSYFIETKNGGLVPNNLTIIK